MIYFRRHVAHLRQRGAASEASEASETKEAGEAGSKMFMALVYFTVVGFAQFGLVLAALATAVAAIVSFVRFCRHKEPRRKKVFLAQPGSKQRMAYFVLVKRSARPSIVLACCCIACALGSAFLPPIVNELPIFDSVNPNWVAEEKNEPDARRYIMQKYGFEPTITSSSHQMPATYSVFYQDVDVCIYEMEYLGKSFTCTYDLPGRIRGGGQLSDDYQAQEISDAYDELVEEVLGVELISKAVTYPGSTTALFEGDPTILSDNSSLVPVPKLAIHLGEDADYEAIFKAAQTPEFRSKLYGNRVGADYNSLEDCGKGYLYNDFARIFFWPSKEKCEEALAEADGSTPNWRQVYTACNAVIYWDGFEDKAHLLDLTGKNSTDGIRCIDEKGRAFFVEKTGAFAEDIASLSFVEGSSQGSGLEVLTPVYKASLAEGEIGEDMTLVMPMGLVAMRAGESGSYRIVFILDDGTYYLADSTGQGEDFLMFSTDQPSGLSWEDFVKIRDRLGADGDVSFFVVGKPR